MTKAEILRYLQPFSDDIEIVIASEKSSAPVAPFFGTSPDDKNVPLTERSRYECVGGTGIVVLKPIDG